MVTISRPALMRDRGRIKRQKGRREIMRKYCLAYRQGTMEIKTTVENHTTKFSVDHEIKVLAYQVVIILKLISCRVNSYRE